MINIRKTKTANKRALSFVVFGSSLLFVAVSAQTQQHQDQSSSLRPKTTIGRPRTLIEPSQCISRETIGAIHRNPNDNRLPLNAGSVESKCYTRNNSCGSADGTAHSACCRIAFANSGGNRDAGWLVCDALNGFEWMPCVCNDNTFGSPTPEPTLPPSLSPTNAATNAPTNTPTNAQTNVPTNVPTNAPTNAPTIEPTNAPTNAPTNVPTNTPTNAPTNALTNSPTKPTTGTLTTATPFATSNPTPILSSVVVVPVTNSPVGDPSESPTSIKDRRITSSPSTPVPTASKPTTGTPTTAAPFATSNPSTGGTTESTIWSTTWSPTVIQTTFSPTVIQTQIKPTNPPTSKTTNKQPTAPPTTKPTARQPSQGPTQQPTTKYPTAPPTTEPTTKKPSQGPTQQPTTQSPTSSPVNTSEAPSTIEDRSITISLPTSAKPTTGIPPPPSSNYQTEYRFDDEFSATILQSQCNESPPVMEFLQGSTFIYRYEIVTLVDETGTLIDTVDLEALTLAGTRNNNNDNDNNEEDISNTYWTNEIHNELANEFMVCNYEQDTVWIIQSKTHVVDYSMACTQGISSFFEGNNGFSAPQPKQGSAAIGTETDGDEGGANNDANSNDSNTQNTCVVMKAEARILVYASPIKRKTNKQLVSWADDYASGPTADAFAIAAISYLNERMNAGDFDRGGLIASFDGGEVLVDENNVNDNVVDTDDINTDNDFDADNDTTKNDVADVTGGNNGEVGTDISINNDGDGDAGVNDNSNTDTNTADEEIDISDTPLSLIDENGNSDGDTAVGIEDSSNSNSNYNEKEGLTAPILATVVVASAFIVLILLMGVSRRRRRNQNRKKEKEEYLREVAGATDTHQDDNSLEYAMVVNHHLDLSDSDSRGDTNEPGPIFQSQLLDLERDDIDNKVVRSPSSRQRSHICPLSSLDEMDSYASTVKSDYGKGNHRGNGIQNKDPRSYQLRDTVNL